MQSTSPRPFVVTVVPETPAEATGLTVGELLVGSVGMAGVMLTTALVLGVVLAGVRVVTRRMFPPVTDHMPRISALDGDVTRPPSPPTQ